jgi:hypothetical protein
MKRILALAVFAFAALAHGQTLSAPPQASSESVVLTWTAPATCTVAAPCTFALWRTVNGAAQWTQVLTTAAQATTATDTSVASGTGYQYVVETVISGINSGPSNVVTVAVPLVPAAPSGLAGSVASSGA